MYCARSLSIVLLLAGLAWAEPIEIPLVKPGYFHEEDVELRGGPEIRLEGTVYTLTLNNGCVLRVDMDALAVSVVNENGVTIFANVPGSICRLTYIADGIGPQVAPVPANAVFTFDRLLLLGESATLYLDARSEDGALSKIEWTFLPVKRIINGKTFNGVSDTFLIVDKTHNLHKINFKGLAARGDDFSGARAFRLACYAQEHGYREAVFGKERRHLGGWGSTIDGGQMFHVIGQRQGTLYEYLEEEAHDMTSMQSDEANSAVAIDHEILIGRVRGVWRSPLRVRLFTEAELTPQLWMELTRSRRNAFHERYGIEPTARRPMLTDRNFWRKRSFADYADKELPGIKDKGFRRIEVGWIYERGRAPCHEKEYTGGYSHDRAGAKTWMAYQGEHKDRITAAAGGAEALKSFTDRAHALGVEVYVWHQTAHGWHGDSIVRNHPDWIVHHFDGSAFMGSMKQCMVWFSLASGFYDHTLTKIRDIKQRTGIDGFWLDMYGSGVASSANYIHAVTAPTVEERASYTRAMREMGLGLYGEGICPTVIDSFVMHEDPNWEGHEFILYGSAPYLMHDKWRLPRFKLLSYQCYPRDHHWWKSDVERTKDEMAEAEKVVYRNRCHNAVEDALGQPIGIVETPLGTQWVHEKGNALFFHKGGDILIPLDKDASVTTVSESGTIEVEKQGGVLSAKVPCESVIIVKFDAASP